MKRLTITGNLGCDAELKQIGQSNYFCFPLAITGSKKDAPTEWVNVNVFAREGSKLGDVLKKGAGVLAFGRNAVRAFVGRDGQARAAETLWADGIEIFKFVDDDAPEEHKAPAGDDDADGSDLPF